MVYMGVRAKKPPGHLKSEPGGSYLLSVVLAGY